MLPTVAKMLLGIVAARLQRAIRDVLLPLGVFSRLQLGFIRGGEAIAQVVTLRQLVLERGWLFSCPNINLH